MTTRQKPDTHKPTIRADIRPRIWPLLCDVVETGMALGWHRAWKHRDDEPADAVAEAVRDTLCQAVEDQFAERFVWDDGEGGDGG